MSFESLSNRGEYLSAHYLEEILPATLKKGQLAQWAEQEKKGRQTPRMGLRALRRTYFDRKVELTELADGAEADERHRKILGELHAEILTALGFTLAPDTHTVTEAGRERVVIAAHAEPGVIAIECGWATDTDAAADPDAAGLLLDPVELDARERIEHGMKLASLLFATEEPPRYVLILNGGVITLADRFAWGEGRYLAVSLDSAFGRNDTRLAGEIDVIAVLFGADSLCPPAEGGDELLSQLVAGSRQHAVGVSSELREGLRLSVELIANEVLDRIRQAGVRPEQIDDGPALAAKLKQESLRYLYRILFLLYAEARPDLGVLPVKDPDYLEGYSMSRLGDLVARPMIGEAARAGFHLHDSLDLLFRKIDKGHRPHGPNEVVHEKTSEGRGIRFEALRSDLFLPKSITLIGRDGPEHPAHLDDETGPTRIDTRLRNECLYQVLRLLMLTKGRKKERGGFISYAQLGITQLGAVYEGLMSYTGFIAEEELYEVAKGGDDKDGSWLVPGPRADDYDDDVFVQRTDPLTGVKTRVRHPAGSFVYRLAGRDRATSASYYTPQSLTQVTVELALKERLDQGGITTPATELLDWSICEPALGSGSFLNEAISQVAAEYLRRRRAELKIDLDPEEHTQELQKIKAYIALHNCYGVDLNDTAVELAEVSLWLNVMHRGLQAPWFGLHLRQGNSLVGAGRRTYTRQDLAKRSWLSKTPMNRPLSAGPIPEGEIHHFLLPAAGWGAVAGFKEAKALEPELAKRLATWRRKVTGQPTLTAAKSSQAARLQALGRRVEWLWDLVGQRLALSEAAVRRQIDVWGAEDLPTGGAERHREQILADLEDAGTPYWRLKTIMDAWCALWFWPLEAVDLLLGETADYPKAQGQPIPVTAAAELSAPDIGQPLPIVYRTDSLLGDDPPEQLLLPPAAAKPKSSAPRRQPNSVTISQRRVALQDLDGWLSFAEAVLGSKDIPAESLVTEFTSLQQLKEYELGLAPWMGLREPHQIADEFPWFIQVERIVNEKTFFHWEIEFAQAFTRGGFDLQVGNPPWVRPRWEETLILAENDPWFGLVENPDQEVWDERRNALLAGESQRAYLLADAASTAGLGGFLSSTTTYPLLVGTQPDLYRAFMSRVWEALSAEGTAGLLHPDTHFVGDKERALRTAAYRHLRVHADFVNSGNRFFPPPVNRSSHFGLHVYGKSSEIDFRHLSWLFDPGVLTKSLEMAQRNESLGLAAELPGVRFQGTWDVRPHPARAVRVTLETLAEWRTIAGSPDEQLETVRLLYPVTDREQNAIVALGSFGHRLGGMEPRVSRGYDEAGAKKSGLIRWNPGPSKVWSDVILKGPQFGLATPFFKQPPQTGTGARPMDLRSLAADAVVGTFYSRVAEVKKYWAAQDSWIDHNSPGPGEEGPSPMRRSTEFYRAVWREQIPDDTDRSLFVCLMPPGPAHIHGVRSMILNSNRETALTVGFWSSIPIDYFLRITGRGHLDVGDAKVLPAPVADHPLADELLLRTLRLNALTDAYGGFWADQYAGSWKTIEWAIPWPGAGPLNVVGAEWTAAAPLRTELERRAALVEMDALVAVWLNLSADELGTIYRARFPIVYDYESVTWFDAAGRKIAGNFNTYGSGQTKDHWKQFQARLEDPDVVEPPEGFTAPFYKADREREMREAHAVFSARLRAAEDAGWRP